MPPAVAPSVVPSARYPRHLLWSVLDFPVRGTFHRTRSTSSSSTCTTTISELFILFFWTRCSGTPSWFRWCMGSTIVTNLRRSTRLGCLRAQIVLFILAGYLILVSGLGLRTGWHSSSVGTKLAQDRQAQEDPGPHSFEELPLWIGTRYGQRADCCQSSSSSSQRLYPGSPVGEGSFSPKSYSHAARQAILVVQLVQEVVLPQCILLPSVRQGLVQGYDLGPFLAAGSQQSLETAAFAWTPTQPRPSSTTSTGTSCQTAAKASQAPGQQGQGEVKGVGHWLSVGYTGF